MEPIASFGPYAILQHIASSGIAESYAAQFLGASGTKVLALKLLQPECSSHEAFASQLAESVKSAVRLNHVNIAQTFDLARWEDISYVALEFVDGRPLSAMIETAASSGTPVGAEFAAFIAGEVCAGLAYAHSRRDAKGKPLAIVHCDIQPRHIMISKDGAVKVVDFAVARARATSGLLDVNAEVGRARYMAPEVARGEEATAAADIFSVGALAFEMIAGLPVYDADTDEGVMELAKAGKVNLAALMTADMPDGLREVLLEAVQPDPGSRYKNANALRSNLTSWLRKNSPGFGRHRLKSFLNDLFPGKQSLLSMRGWQTLHRKDFQVFDVLSLVGPVVDDTEVPRTRDDIHSLLTAGGATAKAAAAQPAAAKAAAATPPPKPAAPATPAAAAKPATPPPKPAVPSKPAEAGTGTLTGAGSPVSDQAAPAPPATPAAPEPTAPVASEPAAPAKPAAAPKPAPPEPAAAKPEPAKPAATTPAAPTPAPPEPAPPEPAAAKPEPAKPAAPEPAPAKPEPAPPAPAIPADSAPELLASKPYGDSESNLPDGTGAAGLSGEVMAGLSAEVRAALVDEADPEVEDLTGRETRVSSDFATAVYDDEAGQDVRHSGSYEYIDDEAVTKKSKGWLGWIAFAIALAGISYAAWHFLLREEVVVVEEVTSVWVSSRPQGAEIYVNESNTGQTTGAALIDLTPGESATIRVTMLGYEPPPSRNVDVVSGQNIEVEFELSPSPHTIHVTTNPPGGTVLYEGAVVGTAEPTVDIGPLSVSYDSGADIMIMMDGYLPERTHVDWSPGDRESSVSLSLRPDPNYIPPPPIEE